MKPRSSMSKTIMMLSLVGFYSTPSFSTELTPTLSPATLAKTGNTDERFQSYNIEMLEVTGGKFWKPYSALDTAHGIVGQPAKPVGMDPAKFAYRPPLDLGNRRLRTLATALSPAYVRTSGTWANSTYFPDADEAPAQPPTGFAGVLTHQQWRGLVEFSNAVGAPIITSFAISPGTRDSSGAWTTEQAKRFLGYTQSIGGHIAAAEYMNEPNIAAIGGAPKGYDAAAYGRDFKIFHAFSRSVAPNLLILGPGSVGENDTAWGMGKTGIPMITTHDLLSAANEDVDHFSYHHYYGVSQRCAPLNQTTEQAALSEEWLARTDITLAFYRQQRDTFEPGKSIWLTETGDSACGGNPWASTFRDTFRYLDQLGRLARQGVKVAAHNTLVASDYGLLDEDSFTPKPNYWGALLWRRLMGTGVLDTGINNRIGLHAYAQCMGGTPGGVVLLVINNDEQQSSKIRLAQPSQRYTLAASGDLSTRDVKLNGTVLKLAADDTLPRLTGVDIKAGDVVFEPATITFLTMPGADNQACR